MKTLARFAVAILPFSVLACGGGGGGDPYPTVEKFCAAKAKAECIVSTKCVTKPDDCATQRAAECMKFAAAAQAAPESATVRPYRSGNVKACIDKVSAVYGKPSITPDDLEAIDDVCNRVFKGTAKSLDMCVSAYDCDGVMICDKKLCAAKVTKKKDELCTNPGEVCDTGLFCSNVSGAVYKCIPRASKTGACDDKTPCLETLRCVAGACADRLAAGESCVSSADCIQAAASAYCDPYFGNKCDTGLSFTAGAPACAGYGGGGSGTDGGVDAAVDSAPGDTAGGDADDASGG